MRMRKLPWAEDYIKEATGCIQDPTVMAGTWRTLLQCETLHVEIGTGKGDYWIGMSQKYPTEGWVGIEKNMNVAALALKKASEYTLDNARFICADAEVIETWFTKGEIDVLHLNFSDPWPKNRNSKRRLSHANFLKKYMDLLANDGQIIMKTDNQKLFEFSLVEFGQNDFVLEEVFVDFRRETHDEDQITEYEQKFMDKGQPIYRAIWRKRG
ncbi:MAG: tRNA (guanosine(46)-N7)-methyltransferase TrmB [Erysipelotrichaceae bacterium]